MSSLRGDRLPGLSLPNPYITAKEVNHACVQELVGTGNPRPRHFAGRGRRPHLRGFRGRPGEHLPCQAGEFRRHARGGRWASPPAARPLPIRSLANIFRSSADRMCKGFVQRRPIWLVRPLGSATPCAGRPSRWSWRRSRFYESAIRQTTDAGIRQLLGDLAEEERKHERLAEEMVQEESPRRRRRRRTPLSSCRWCNRASPG